MYDSRTNNKREEFASKCCWIRKEFALLLEDFVFGRCERFRFELNGLDFWATHGVDSFWSTDAKALACVSSLITADQWIVLLRDSSGD
jgi:hypothetical protein